MSLTQQHQLAQSVTVSNPEHQGKGRSKTTEYLVTTQFPKAESLVRRTFEDFEWIQQRLAEERVGIIVPVVPNKKLANGKKVTREALFDDQLVQQRQETLQRFLQRVVAHPDLVDAPCLLPFLTASPVDWKSAQDIANQRTREETEQSNHESMHEQMNGGVDAHTVVISAEAAPERKKKGWFGKIIAAKKDQWALRNKNLLLEETPVESKKFNDMQEYADHLETCVRILAEDCEQLLDSLQAQSEKWQTLGAAHSQLWGEHELSNMASSTMYQHVGESWSAMSKHIAEQEDNGRRQLQSPLEELVLDVEALKNSLNKRKEASYDYTKKVQYGRKLQQQMDKLKATGDLSAVQDQYFSWNAISGRATLLCRKLSS